MNLSKYSKAVQDRIHLTHSCKDFDYVSAHEKAGQVIDNYQYMHNGLIVTKDCYYGEWMTDLIELCKGHHEPQEEKAFYEVLKYIPENSTMIELGSYWSFYSMWFNKNIKNAINYMIEPVLENLNIGKEHFKINNMNGIFLNDSIPNFKIDKFVQNNNIKHISILHSDIQGFEYHMLVDDSHSQNNTP